MTVTSIGAESKVLALTLVDVVTIAPGAFLLGLVVGLALAWGRFRVR